MVRSLEAVTRGRFALVVVLLGVVSALTAASLAPTMSSQAVVVVATLCAATALMGTHALRSLRPPRRAADIPLVLAGRTTDVGHHPVRPRAPGRV